MRNKQIVLAIFSMLLLLCSCAAPDSGLSVYSDGSVTLCFTEEAPGGPEILLHIHVQSGDAAYLGVRLGDRVDALVEALETQNAVPGEHWIIDHDDCAADGPASPSASRKRTDVSRSCSCMLTDNRCVEFHAQI